MISSSIQLTTIALLTTAWILNTTTATSAVNGASATSTTHTWSFTTFWSPYYSYWPIVYEMNDRPYNFRPNYYPDIPIAEQSDLAQNRLFPSHPRNNHKETTTTTTSYLHAVKPEHRLFPSSLRPPDIFDDRDGPTATVEHRHFSYMSSSSPTPDNTPKTLRKRSIEIERNELPISSTVVVFPQSSSTEMAEDKTDVETEIEKPQSPQPTKTEGKLVLEGLSLIGSLLRPGSRPSLFSSSTSNGLSPLLSSITSSNNGLHHPFLASSSNTNHPLMTSSTSNSGLLQHYAPHLFGEHHQPLQNLHSYLFPGVSALYPSAIYPPPLASPYGSIQQPQTAQHGLGQALSSGYYPGTAPSPYQALGVENLLVPLIGMIGLNLLRPDIIKSRREGLLSDLDGIDVFRNLEQESDECLRRLACETGVTIADSDDVITIQKALERALAARRLVPSRHVSRKTTDMKRLHCGHHNCTTFDSLTDEDDESLQLTSSSELPFKQAT